MSLLPCQGPPPFLAGAFGGPQERQGVQQISRPGEAVREGSSTRSPCRGPHRSPSKGFPEQSRAAAPPPAHPACPTDPAPPLPSAPGTPNRPRSSLPRAPPRLFGWSGRKLVGAEAPPSVSLGPEQRRRGSIPGSPGPIIHQRGRLDRKKPGGSLGRQAPEDLPTDPQCLARPRRRRHPRPARSPLTAAARPAVTPPPRARPARLSQPPQEGERGARLRTRSGRRRLPIPRPAAAQTAHEEPRRPTRCPPRALLRLAAADCSSGGTPAPASPRDPAPTPRFCSPFLPPRRPGTRSLRRARGRFWGRECKQIGVL